VSQTILPSSRSFFAEAKIPTTQSLKPNLIALVHIKDYTSSNTIVIPVNTLQTDEQGKYVYVMADEKGKKIARKKPVQVGEIYGDQIEVKSGLSEGEQLITEGFQSVYDGQPITTEVK
jgi:multidrug efflux pump subunit AcrA (membrane-fusion protein)